MLLDLFDSPPDSDESSSGGDDDSTEDGAPSRASVAMNLSSSSVSKAHKLLRIQGALYLESIQTSRQHVPEERTRILNLLNTFANERLGGPKQESPPQQSEAYAQKQASIPWPPPPKTEGPPLPAEQDTTELHRISSAGIVKTRINDIQSKEPPPLDNRPLGGTDSASRGTEHQCIASDT